MHLHRVSTVASGGTDRTSEIVVRATDTCRDALLARKRGIRNGLVRLDWATVACGIRSATNTGNLTVMGDGNQWAEAFFKDFTNDTLKVLADVRSMLTKIEVLDHRGKVHPHVGR